MLVSSLPVDKMEQSFYEQSESVNIKMVGTKMSPFRRRSVRHHSEQNILVRNAL